MNLRSRLVALPLPWEKPAKRARKAKAAPTDSDAPVKKTPIPPAPLRRKKPTTKFTHRKRARVIKSEEGSGEEEEKVVFEAVPTFEEDSKPSLPRSPSPVAAPGNEASVAEASQRDTASEGEPAAPVVEGEEGATTDVLAVEVIGGLNGTATESVEAAPSPPRAVPLSPRKRNLTVLSEEVRSPPLKRRLRSAKLEPQDAPQPQPKTEPEPELEPEPQPIAQPRRSARVRAATTKPKNPTTATTTAKAKAKRTTTATATATRRTKTAAGTRTRTRTTVKKEVKTEMIEETVRTSSDFGPGSSSSRQSINVFSDSPLSMPPPSPQLLPVDTELELPPPVVRGRIVLSTSFTVLPATPASLIDEQPAPAEDLPRADGGEVVVEGETLEEAVPAVLAVPPPDVPGATKLIITPKLSPVSDAETGLPEPPALILPLVNDGADAPCAADECISDLPTSHGSRDPPGTILPLSPAVTVDTGSPIDDTPHRSLSAEPIPSVQVLSIIAASSLNPGGGEPTSSKEAVVAAASVFVAPLQAERAPPSPEEGPAFITPPTAPAPTSPPPAPVKRPVSFWMPPVPPMAPAPQSPSSPSPAPKAPGNNAPLVQGSSPPWSPPSPPGRFAFDLSGSNIQDLETTQGPSSTPYNPLDLLVQAAAIVEARDAALASQAKGPPPEVKPEPVFPARPTRTRKPTEKAAASAPFPKRQRTSKSDPITTGPGSARRGRSRVARGTTNPRAPKPAAAKAANGAANGKR